LILKETKKEIGKMELFTGDATDGLRFKYNTFDSWVQEHV